MDLKTQELNRKAVGKRMRGGCPVGGAGAPGSGAPRILFLTALTIDFLRFEVQFSCFLWVLRRDSISGHLWHGFRTNPIQILDVKRVPHQACACCVSIPFATKMAFQIEAWQPFPSKKITRPTRHKS